MTKLETLIETIRTAHRAAYGSAQTALEHARRAGEALTTAKAQLTHGAWLPWLAANFDFTPRTAQGYMRIAGRWSELQTKNETAVSHLSLREALALLTPARELVPHEYCLIFPAMTAAEFEGLKDSLRRFGYLSECGAITLYQGQILDGKERFRACRDVGVEPEFEDFDGDDEAAISLVMSRNYYRQHFTPSQRAALEVELGAAA